MSEEHTPPLIRLGLPRSIMNELADEAMSLGAPVLISMGALYEAAKKDFVRIGMVPWFLDAALDSAGFTAMQQGGYRWSVWDHVELVATSSSRVWGSAEPGPCELPFPWTWWAAMDYCCEQAVAPNRLEVERRMARTIDNYEETLAAVASFWAEGFTELTRPLPTLQGRRPSDYILSARMLAEAWQRRPLSTSEEEDQDYLGHLPPGLTLCEVEDVCERDQQLVSELPELLGVGSVCGREVEGPEGVLAVLDALHQELPRGVKLHLFGAKGDVLRYLHLFPGRVASIDSMAWDTAARRAAGRIRKKRGVFSPQHSDFFSCDMAWRRQHMRQWYQSQLEKVGCHASRQLRLNLPQ